ncbi:hypothetical protein BDV18DRAFT_133393 [Aspergillus unguis]
MMLAKEPGIIVVRVAFEGAANRSELLHLGIFLLFLFIFPIAFSVSHLSPFSRSFSGACRFDPTAFSFIIRSIRPFNKPRNVSLSAATSTSFESRVYLEGPEST